MGEFDGFCGVTAVAGQGWQGDGVPTQGDGVIGIDDALIMQCETAGQIETTGQRAEVAGGLGGGTGEALVVVGAELLKHGVGLGQSGRPSEAKFADQAVLAGAPGALDAALGLRGVGGDLLDAELVESTSQLGGRLCSGELFGEGPVRVVALEDGVAVAVEAERNAVGGDHGVQGAEIADGIFGLELEVSGENLAGGVILKTDQGEFRAAALEPVMTAGVGVRHHAETGAGRASGAILARAPLLRRSQFRELLRPTFDAVGWETKRDEQGAAATNLRASLITALGNLNDPKVVASCLERFKAFLANPESLAPDLRPAVFSVVGRYADEATWNELHQLGLKTTSAEEKQNYYDALAGAMDPKLVKKTLPIALTDELPTSRAVFLVSRVARESGHSDIAWDFARANMKALLAKTDALGANTYAPSLFIFFSDDSRAEELRTYTKNSLPAASVPEVAKAVDEIHFRSEFKKRLARQLNVWID